jgi:hypothetical protein
VKRWLWWTVLAASAVPVAALAQPSAVPKASSAPTGVASTAAAPAASAAPTQASDKAPGLCVERLPEGKARPRITEKISARGTSGHAHSLELSIEHGAGETVLPGGFRVEPSSDELRRLEAAEFFFPDASGAAAPSIQRTVSGDRATTRVKLFFVPLPAKPGRNELVLPPLPITVARASGEIMTLCTASHAITVEDPIANEPNPKPKPNPGARRQLEEWTLAKHVTYAALVALVAGALIAFLVGRWLKRPRLSPPPPPPRPPWEVAMEGLYDVRHSGLASEQRFVELYDRTADIMRRYLGDRYGYDGLESTTREALASLRRVALPMDTWVEIQTFMQDADLVKFARRAPTEAEYVAALERAEAIVLRTRPDENQAFPAAPEPAPAEVR